MRSLKNNYGNLSSKLIVFWMRVFFQFNINFNVDVKPGKSKQFIKDTNCFSNCWHCNCLNASISSKWSNSNYRKNRYRCMSQFRNLHFGSESVYISNMIRYPGFWIPIMICLIDGCCLQRRCETMGSYRWIWCLKFQTLNDPITSWLIIMISFYNDMTTNLIHMS